MAGNEYGACDWCGWNGKLRNDGMMRRHRVMADSGKAGSTGSLPQLANGDYCKGSGEAPYTPMHESSDATEQPAEAVFVQVCVSCGHPAHLNICGIKHVAGPHVLPCGCGAVVRAAAPAHPERCGAVDADDLDACGHCADCNPKTTTEEGTVMENRLAELRRDLTNKLLNYYVVVHHVSSVDAGPTVEAELQAFQDAAVRESLVHPEPQPVDTERPACPKLKAGDEVILIAHAHRGWEETVVQVHRIGRKYAYLRRPEDMGRENTYFETRVDLVTQSSPDGGNHKSRFVTREQFAWEQRRTVARAVLVEAFGPEFRFGLRRGAAWQGRELELANLLLRHEGKQEI